LTLTLITINLNNLSGLKKTVASVIGQTLNIVEYIIIDGGSTDGSVDFLGEIQNPNVQWISEPDTGVYHAMNKGIQKASSDFVLFLNSGDILAHTAVLADIQTFFENSKVNGQTIYYGYMRRGTPEDYSVVDVPSALPIAYLIENSLPHPATLIPRYLFQKFGCYDESYRIVSDWKFFMKCYFGRVAFCKLPVVVSYFDTDGLSSNHTQLFEERERVFSEMWKLRFCRGLIQTYRFLKYSLLKTSPKTT
jgi:glycosyltransferase involved in cell wall biosynthesis